jgi:hypothetical protein
MFLIRRRLGVLVAAISNRSMGFPKFGRAPRDINSGDYSHLENTADFQTLRVFENP